MHIFVAASVASHTRLVRLCRGDFRTKVIEKDVPALHTRWVVSGRIPLTLGIFKSGEKPVKRFEHM